MQCGGENQFNTLSWMDRLGIDGRAQQKKNIKASALEILRQAALIIEGVSARLARVNERSCAGVCGNS